MVAWIRRLAGRHPSSKQLVELATGGGLEPSAARHVDGCPRCRRRLRSLRRDWRRTLAIEAAAGFQQEPDFDAVLARIFTAIRSAADLRVPSIAALTERRRQLCERLVSLMSDCFGDYGLAAASGSLNEPPDPARTVAQCGDLLSTFLGRKVVTQITDLVLSQSSLHGV